MQLLDAIMGNIRQLEWADILRYQNCKKHNNLRHWVLAPHCKIHSHRNTDKHHRALSLFFDGRNVGT